MIPQASRTASNVVLRAALALATASACSSEPMPSGVDEPVRVFGGQFREGELPGLPPLTPEQSGEGVQPVSPRVIDVTGGGGILRYGDPEQHIQGTATADAVAVAFRFANLGTGYWITPVRTLDTSNPDLPFYSWGFSAEFSRAIPPGRHVLLYAAIDAEGRSGTQLDRGGGTFCRTREIPDNDNVCSPTRRPPTLVASLAWDVDADLDLQLLTPNGEFLDAREKRNTDAADDAAGTLEPGSIALQADSNAGCAIDGIRRENFAFEEPPSGTYYFYANLFDACGERDVHFTLTFHVPADGAEPGEFTQVELYRSSGTLLAAQANGGARVGLFVTSFIVP